MSQVQALSSVSSSRIRDLIDLGKPRLSLLVLFTAAIGLWLAPNQPSMLHSLLFLAATSCLVAAANTLNCWLEREIDGRMLRTASRPLPTGRLEARTALMSGVLLGAGATIVLGVVTNLLTTALGVAALLIYVAIYTPMKRWSPLALFVGAVPGALPPLMGWTAATDSLTVPGWYLFGLLFLWQLPHFSAIALYLREDYDRGGIRVLSLVYGTLATRRWLQVFSVAVVLHGLAAWPLGLAGPTYGAVAALLGAAFLVLAFSPVGPRGIDAWARRLFGFTLLYLPVLAAILVLDAR